MTFSRKRPLNISVYLLLGPCRHPRRLTAAQAAQHLLYLWLHERRGSTANWVVLGRGGGGDEASYCSAFSPIIKKNRTEKERNADLQWIRRNLHLHDTNFFFSSYFPHCVHVVCVGTSVCSWVWCWQRQRSSTRKESWQSRVFVWLCWWWASCVWLPTVKPSKSCRRVDQLMFFCFLFLLNI